MNTHKLFLSVLLCLLSTVGTYAQNKNITVVEIQTSAICNMCKENIERALAYEKGVVSATLNLDDKIVSVSYKTNKTDIDKLREAISKAGYKADHVEADPDTFNRLAPCCKGDDGYHK